MLHSSHSFIFFLLFHVVFFFFFFFFFQAEDGIRDHCVTGVQTCALPICSSSSQPRRATIPIVKSTASGSFSSESTSPLEDIPASVLAHAGIGTNTVPRLASRASYPIA